MQQESPGQAQRVAQRKRAHFAIRGPYRLAQDDEGPRRAKARLMATSSPANQLSSKPSQASNAARVQNTKQPNAIRVSRNTGTSSPATKRSPVGVPRSWTAAPTQTAPSCNWANATPRTAASIVVSASTNTRVLPTAAFAPDCAWRRYAGIAPGQGALRCARQWLTSHRWSHRRLPRFRSARRMRASRHGSTRVLPRSAVLSRAPGR